MNIPSVITQKHIIASQERARPPKGGLLGAEEVGDCAVGEADNNMHSGDRPREGEVVEDLLVPQVEHDIQAVPAQV